MKDFIEVLAILVSPIIAVWVGSYLQTRTEKRKDKIVLFKALMTERIDGWSYGSVNALNIIDIVFDDDVKVRTAWKNLYEKYAIDSGTDEIYKEIQELQHKLLEAMAVSLGYKEKIIWDSIRKPYLPKGLVELQEQQKQFQQGQLEVLDIARDWRKCFMGTANR